MSEFQQISRLGELSSAVDEAAGRLDRDRALERLWQRDASLWKDDPAHAKIIANSLGWLEIATQLEPKLPELEALARQVREAGFESCVLLGMGGSSLCTEVHRLSALPDPAFPRMLVLDSTVPASVTRIEASCRLEKTLFLVASKSGGTAETAAFYAYFYGLLKGLKGDRAGENFVAITDPGTKMEASARADGFRDVRLNPPDIGGRFSALSYFGLLPAALMGVDLSGYVRRAVDAQESCRPTTDPSRNPGLWLGAALGGLAGAGRDKLTLVTTPGLQALGLWIEQLIAESTGKEGKGILPVAGETLGDPGDYGSDRVFVRVRLSDESDATQDRNLAALAEAGHPVIEHVLPSALDLGAEFYRWEIATALVGYLLGINPFDQPNVQESKDYTVALLREYEERGDLTEPETVARYESLTFHVDPANKGALSAAIEGRDGRDRAVALLRAHLGRVQSGDYVALTQYVDESASRDDRILGTRLAIRNAFRVATTTGYGPRFLHSTGQFHKGGPNTGVFLQLTADDGRGQPIPSRPYDFATLARAQALGDFQALSAHQRRAVRIHLGSDVEKGLRQFDELIRENLR